MWDVPYAPIAILPVAGLLLGFGSSFTNETTIATYGLQKILGDGTILNALLVIMNKVGSAVFDNLPLIFAVGVAIGMAKKRERGSSSFRTDRLYFVMNVAINGMLVVNGKITADGQIAKSVLEGTVTSVCGIQSCRWVCSAVLSSALVLRHCITVSIRSCFQMHFLSLAVPDLCRSFPPLYTCLWEF